MSEGESFNYFNYFTEIEEHFQKARGSGLFLLSPLDWALVEIWKDTGIPLEAVLRGIDKAFEQWHKKKSKSQQVNSIAYCAQAVMSEARRIETPRDSQPTEPVFQTADLRRHLLDSAAILPADFAEIRSSLENLAAEIESWLDRLEALEQHLAALEEKMIALVRGRQSEGEAVSIRRQLDAQLKPYRGKMSAAELMLIERKFLDRHLFESRGLPRLSLFYLN